MESNNPIKETLTNYHHDIELFLELKKFRNFSFQQIAEGTGYSKTIWVKAFNYQTKLTDDQKWKLSNFLDVNPLVVWTE